MAIAPLSKLSSIALYISRPLRGEKSYSPLSMHLWKKVPNLYQLWGESGLDDGASQQSSVWMASILCVDERAAELFMSSPMGLVVKRLIKPLIDLVPWCASALTCASVKSD